MNKKIAFVVPSYLPAKLSGSDKYVQFVAEDFAERGHDISIITTKALTPRYWYDPIFGKSRNVAFETINKVKVYRLNCNFLLSSIFFIFNKLFGRIIPKYLSNRLLILLNGPWLMGLRKTLIDKDFDVVHSSPFPLNINRQIANSIKKLKKKPRLIFTPFFHDKVPGFDNPVIQDIFDCADTIHVISNAEKKEITERFPEVDRKIDVIPLFLKLSDEYSCLVLKDEVKKIRDKYNLKGRKIILFAGNKGIMKGVIDLLYVISSLYKKDNKYLLIALGAGTSQWNRAKKKINQDCLLDLKYTDGKYKQAFYCLADMYCMPSKSETFGLAYLEAWSKKKPVIAADIPAVRELVSANRGGILVKFGDRKELERAIVSLLNNKKIADKLGENGYDALINKYSYKQMRPKYINLFK